MPLPISRNRLGAAALLLVAALATGCARTVPAPRSTAAPLPFPAATTSSRGTLGAGWWK